MTQGERQAEEFLTALAFERAWRRVDTTALASCLADDAELISTDPFPHGPGPAGRQLHEVVGSCPTTSAWI